ncbi:AAA family ATPase [Novosphingobium fluoreni]|uniref:AAA family ATPase n=1 Tax=Novosphingobium fluoreni TaxID=1391222 RepID=UPI003DA07F74
MRLNSFRVLGFQSFSDSGDIELGEGINLIVGQNNVGKSSLLRALQSSLADDRHRTPERWETYRLPHPEVKLDIAFSGGELRNMLLQMGGAFIPSPQNVNAQEFAEELLSSPQIIVNASHRPGIRFNATYPAHGRFEWNKLNQQVCAFSDPSGGTLTFTHTYHGDDSVPEAVHRLWDEKMFYFSAERMNVGVSSAGPAHRLSPNAQNLPSVLLTLSGDRGDVFKRLVEHVREVFPTIGNVSVRPVGGGQIEIRVWPTEAMERVELSFPLLQSGTGVSQVLSVLAAIMTVDHAVLIIDEINSFLHPAAVKSLLRIIKTNYASHQYIVSTHSPEVISFSNPSSITLVKREAYESEVTHLKTEEVDAFRGVAEHLGVSMADVFAADRVIWVEGPTEERCFPVVYTHFAGQKVPRGTIFTSVMATGDFMTRRRDKEIVYKIYQRLSKVAVPLVVAVAFSFDSEDLTDTEKANMKRDSGGAMHFLPRRMIECYLVHPSAIAAFITIRDQELGQAVDEQVVAEMLKELAGSEKFAVAGWRGDILEAGWLQNVDAANLIAEACGSLSDYRVTFNKKDDTLWLLQNILENYPHHVSELSAYVQDLVNAVN